MTEIELRNKVAARARAWLGRKEADGSHREIIDIYNKGRLPGSYAMTYTDPWCAAFVSAVGMSCGLSDIILPHVNCDGMIAAYKAKGRWQEADNYPAKIGDLILYDWQDSGVGDNTGSADHVGIIVDTTPTTMTVIEGNKSGMVAYRTMSRNGRYIRGFCCPDYASKATESETVVVEDKPGVNNTAEQTNDSADHPTEQYHSHTYYVPLPLLKLGNYGPVVENVQALLNRHGADLEVTGKYDGPTVEAVTNFQAKNGLTVDGETGGETYYKLFTT